MNRLGIFSFYDKDGVVDEYVEYLLVDLCENLSELIIVVNGNLNIQGHKTFSKFTNKVLLRDNCGLDAGAYKFVLLNYIGESKLKKFDELVLCNDTFYGPFVPFSSIFEKVQNNDVDFGGINKVSNKIADHIQSYFLVFRKKIIMSGDLIQYFKTYIDENTNNYDEVCATFEVGLFYELIRKGYRHNTYCDTLNTDVYKSSSICMEEYALPILKKRSFATEEYEHENMCKSLLWIEEKTNYDSSLIIKSAKRLYGCEIDKSILRKYTNVTPKTYKYPVAVVTEKDIRNFREKNKELYIYGTGRVARKIYNLYFRGSPKVIGFVVSCGQINKENSLYGIPVIYSNELREETGIIVAVNVSNTREIKKHLKWKENIMYLW